MPGVYADLRAFALEHRGCGDLQGDADPIKGDRYRLWAACSCGACLERWVTAADAEADILHSALLAFEN